MTPADKQHIIVLDGHVHLYDCFILADVLDAAYENLIVEARRQECSASFTGVLLLAESSGCNWYSRLVEWARQSTSVNAATRHGWQLQPLQEERCSLLAQRPTGERLLLIAGRQLVTAEGLEVLSLASDMTIEDGRTTEDVVRAVQQNGGLPVLPWGVGKWLGRRGTLITRLLNSDARSGVLLGDNGGRPLCWPDPFQFRAAHAAGIKILPGSDPLPIPAEATRVGGFGATLQATLSAAHPARDIRQLLRDPRVELRPYGHLMRPYRFMRNQLLIRRRNKSNDATAPHMTGP